MAACRSIALKVLSLEDDFMKTMVVVVYGACGDSRRKGVIIARWAPLLEVERQTSMCPYEVFINRLEGKVLIFPLEGLRGVPLLVMGMRF